MRKNYMLCILIVVLIFCSSCAKKTEYQELIIHAEDFHRSSNTLLKYVGDELVGHSETYEGIYYDVVLPDGYDAIGSNALSGRYNVVSYYVPDTVEKIENCAFAFSYNLRSIRLSDNLTYIGVEAFRSAGLESVEIPASVTQIGDSAFERCKKLSKVVINNPNTDIADTAFSGCSSNLTIYAPEGATAQKYARSCGYNFKILNK